MVTQEKHMTFQEVIDNSPLVLVDFFTEWCGPCKMMKPILEEVKASMGDKVRIVKVDVEKNVNAAASFQVSGVPTLVLFKKGQLVWRQSGVVRPGPLKQIIESYL
jgi:thioredoxin 1